MPLAFSETFSIDPRRWRNLYGLPAACLQLVCETEL
jgi:hypothetical protein